MGWKFVATENQRVVFMIRWLIASDGHFETDSSGDIPMSYQPSSKVLFLTNCSLTKEIGGGTDYYDEGRAITSALPDDLRGRLLKQRANVLQLVRNATDFDWQDTPVSELEYNRDLSSGKDLGGRHAAVYLPALDRYKGRFFQALGSAGKRRLVESGHHTLFLSGLYGLLRLTRISHQGVE